MWSKPQDGTKLRLKYTRSTLVYFNIISKYVMKKNVGEKTYWHHHIIQHKNLKHFKLEAGNVTSKDK